MAPVAIPALMVAAALLCGGVVALVMGAGSRGAVLAGTAGPLVAAVVTWVIVDRVHRRAPAGVAAAMIKLFAAKIVFFGAYVVAVVTLLPVPARAFIVSFTSQYIMLHFIEAIFLRRLFAEGTRRSGLD
jgi:hypothetical protein